MREREEVQEVSRGGVRRGLALSQPEIRNGSVSEGVSVQRLGQSGFRFQFPGHVVYVDPYLSNSVAEREGPHLARLLPIPLEPERITDADLVCITHIHLDHCDDETLGPISTASPRSRFLGPAEVLEYLARAISLPEQRAVLATEEWMDFGRGLRVRPVPAAHPTLDRDRGGHLRSVGFVFEMGGRRFYHSGDCSAHQKVVACLQDMAPIEVAFLPVNECNFYRMRLGIIGNMSIREAFGVAEEIGVNTVVPMHYDMFAPNSVYRAEIEAVYEGLRPSFALKFDPSEI